MNTNYEEHDRNEWKEIDNNNNNNNKKKMINYTK